MHTSRESYLWSFIFLCSVVAACSPFDSAAGVPYGGNPPPNGCSTGTTVALAEPLPGATNVPAQTRKIYIASSPGIRLADAAVVLAQIHGPSDPHLGPRRLVGPVATPFITPLPPNPFPSPLYYIADGFRLKRNHAYYVEVAVLGSSCRHTKIVGARFKTAPY